MRSLRSYSWLTVVLVSWMGFALVFGGCSDELTPAEPVDLPFTMFGVLNPTADTQAVAVYPIESGVLRPLDDTLNAVVRSRNLATGERHVWTDSVISVGGGDHVHIFWSAFRPDYGAPHEVQVEGADGSRSAVTIDVPQQIQIESSDDGTPQTTISFQGGAFRLVQVDVTYEVHIAGGPVPECPGISPLFRYTFSYAEREEAVDGGWDLALDLSEYVRTMEQLAIRDTGNFLLFADQPTRLALVSLRLNVTIGDNTWDIPHGYLDRRILSHPGTLTNVQNGLGFVGAGYRMETRLYPSREAIEEAGMYDYLVGRPGCGSVVL